MTISIGIFTPDIDSSHILADHAERQANAFFPFTGPEWKRNISFARNCSCAVEIR